MGDWKNESISDLWKRFQNWRGAAKGRTLLTTSLVLLIVSFFGGLIAPGVLFELLFYTGLILLSVWLWQRFAARVLGKEQVVEQWGILIGDAQDRAGDIFEDSQRLVAESQAPDIDMERQDVAPGVIRGVLGGRRPFLLVTNNTNSNLKPYRMYISARDYGNNLQVSWYLVHQPSFWRRLLALFLLVPGLNLLILPFYLIGRLFTARQAGLLDLDLFDLQDLTAYVTNAHHCLLEAVEKLMLDLNQDPSKIDRKSRGFLGIS